VSWIRAAHRDELWPDLAHIVALPRDARTGRPREAIVVLDQYGAVRAYLNVCQHIPIPLDGGSREFFDASGDHLRCGTHGALYRREDGFCFVGPCAGESLLALPIRIDDAGVVEIEDLDIEL
jgi:nitrite reductase/ring-hydroxylating ferredoxin subunit